MTRFCVLEINDWQLSSYDDQGHPINVESGAASTATGDLVFGDAAWEHSRTAPLKFNSRYFASVNADAISGDLGVAKNHADLIYHHLRQTPLPDQPVVLGVAGYLNNQQLGLLLGICKEAGVTVAGFVDRAVAHCRAAPLGNEFHVLDIELHRLALSRFTCEANLAQMEACLALDGMGVVNIVDGWMNVAADEFVQKTRFDPLHAGRSEQLLFDQIYGWLGSSAPADRRVSVTHGDATREIEVGQRLLQDKLLQRLRGLDLSSVATLAVTGRIQQIPGLCDALSKMVPELVALSPDDAIHGYLELGQELNPDQVTRITRSPLREHRPARAAAPSSPAPTHLLSGDEAFSIRHSMFAGYLDGASSTLRLGDRIVVGQREFVAIRVNEGHG